jgi:nitrogen fixation protein NifU and related proteins
MSTELDSLYQEIILDHYRHPHHQGLREPFEAEVHHVNPTCGDEVTLRVHVADGRVADVSYDALGCSISQASTSVMTDLVIGKPVDEAMAIHEEFLTLMQGKGLVEPDEDVLEDGIAFAGVAKFPARIKCALLSWMAWKDATLTSVETTTLVEPTTSVEPVETTTSVERTAPVEPVEATTSVERTAPVEPVETMEEAT